MERQILMKKNRIKPVSRQQILDQGGIFIDRLPDGFDQYPSCILTNSEIGYQKLLLKMLELNGEDHSYFDFYFSQLEPHAKEGLGGELDSKMRGMLDQIDWEAGIYFPLDPEVLAVVNHITAKAYLFSTFYFTKFPCVVWGNYDLRYPIFFGSKEVQMVYRSHGLLNQAEKLVRS